jgi:hemerythrin superfamily protein
MNYLSEDAVDNENYFKVLEYCESILGVGFDRKLFDFYITSAQDFIFDYCRVVDVPLTLLTTIADMVVFQYRQKGVENIQSETKGTTSQIFLIEYPPNIMKRLKAHKKAIFR